MQVGMSVRGLVAVAAMVSGAASGCELEVAAEHTRERGAALARTATWQLECDVSDRSKLTAQIERGRDADGRHQRLGFEARRRLGDGGEAPIEWSAVLGAGVGQLGDMAWRLDDGLLGLEAVVRPWTDWQIEAKVGLQRDRREQRTLVPWMLTAERAVAAFGAWRFELEGTGRERPMASIGLDWTISPQPITLKWTQGWQTGTPHERRLGLALSVEF